MSCELSRWSKSAKESTDQRQTQNFKHRHPGENKLGTSAQEQIHLKLHRVSNAGADHNTHKASCKYQDQSFIEIKQFDAFLCHSDRAQHSNFLCLVIQIGTH